MVTGPQEAVESEAVLWRSVVPSAQTFSKKFLVNVFVIHNLAKAYGCKCTKKLTETNT